MYFHIVVTMDTEYYIVYRKNFRFITLRYIDYKYLAHGYLGNEKLKVKLYEI